MSKVETMRQALEALVNSVDLVQYEYDHAVEMYGQYPTRAARINGLRELLEAHKNSITNLSQAIEQAEKQEEWGPSDTAYRPSGLSQDFIKHEVDALNDWSEWVCPDPTQYLMKCCDCGLVHEMQFKVVKYSEVDECDFVADADLQAVFRARRVASQSAPAQQPLTDERIQWLIDGMPNYDSWGRVVRDGIVNLHEFARAIEQAHGIKGEKK